MLDIFSLLILLLTSCLTVCIPVHTKGLYTKETSLFDPGSNSALKYWTNHQIQSLSAVQEHLFETKSRCLRISEADCKMKTPVREAVIGVADNRYMKIRVISSRF